MLWLLSLLITLNHIWGVRLRYAPFYGIINSDQHRKLIILYIVSLCCNVAVLQLAFRHFGVSIHAIQVDAFAISAFTALSNRKVVKGRWKEHLFVLGITESCSFLVMSLPILIVNLCGGYKDLRSYLFSTVFYGFLLLASFRPVRRLLRHTVEPFLSLDTGTYWTTVWFLPLGIFFGMSFNSGPNFESMTAMRMISRCFLAAVMILLCLSIANEQKRMAELEQIHTQLMDQRLHYAQLQTKVEDARKNAHNYMHHIAAMRSLIERKDLDGLLEYCDSLTEEYGFRNNIPYTGNPALDGVIYRYIKLSREHQIHFTYQGTVQTGGVSDLDLCVLLGNALENAVAGCLTTDRNREILVYAENEEKLLSILVRNSFDGLVLEQEERLLSRKRQNAPGLGLDSMRSVCDRCGGTMQTQWDAHSFTVLFLLPIDS